MQANKEIRAKAREMKVPLWSIASALGISEPTMTRKMRNELSEKTKLQIFDIIEAIAKKEATSNENENN